jgi:hypothetical protein
MLLSMLADAKVLADLDNCRYGSVIEYLMVTSWLQTYAALRMNDVKLEVCVGVLNIKLKTASM